MSDGVEVYRVMDRRPRKTAAWLLRTAYQHGAREPRADRAPWSALARTLTAAGRLLWRAQNPQMRWQAEWPGCRRAVRALTKRGAYAKAHRTRATQNGAGHA
ncbi:hypothetical protein Krad_1735 [Kineococcus radiotolerans SRS30216 = ATCC BAA-149]|uniref:Uncharacterized protein n=1 Tax=Kineococcus radiotolerans (strain ATCC BAA-149 / DSM 14245 / SRS30216) TaxID=266940 RepID=A6W8T2_KINRD|nr:hypothetical protein Krad_1735 [Kineococcus radiotolerans SRS30216 = ATCC BAA-149]